ncbi:PP2C family serine/threonine-protein phosphatase [Metabacillus arenae]|uniref:SpoIIE family protein phosphatase n=1 Tax=Metabacillus arenae TaxID=2771434 RepID=A0A926NEQ9_9BACI|nr:PP2C family serine/threonine-protein phosphatase [Metabacillus arenae]MBD1382139.1 SpoIIE family protein phosphatase [Metabacillus arenae]
MIQFESNPFVHTLAYQVGKKGTVYCGDSYFIKATNEYFICVVADGLGSGEMAYMSSAAISRVVENHHEDNVQSLMERCNTVVKDKRGATVSILKVEFTNKQFVYSSVGNIVFVLYSPSGKFIYPLPILGYLSGKPQKYRTQSYSYEKGSKFILYTDGLKAPSVKSLLKDFHTIEDISNHLEAYTRKRDDDLTYIVGQLL